MTRRLLASAFVTYCGIAVADANCVYQAIGTAVGAAIGISVANGNTIAWPTHQADDIGILMVETSGQEILGCQPSGWTQISGSPEFDIQDATGSLFHVFWKRAASSSESGVEVCDSGDHQVGIIATFRGCVATEQPVDSSAVTKKTSASTTATTPAITTTTANTTVLMLASRPNDSGAPSFNTPVNADLTSIAERADEGTLQGHGGGWAMYTGTKAAAGNVGAGTITCSNVTNVTYTIALKTDAATASATPAPGRRTVVFNN